MNRRSLIIQAFAALAMSVMTSEKSQAAQRVYPEDFHTVGEDWTAAFQSAINAAGKNQEIYVKKGLYKIDPIFFKSNIRMFLEKGVVITRYGSYPMGNDCIFSFLDITDVTIIGYGAVLDMNAQDVKGDWRHNIAIAGSNNITIKGLKSMHAGGDGFYIGSSFKKKKSYSSNIVLDKVIAESNRRQGLSIISVKDCKIINSKFLKTSGTAPSAGIDIEPDSDSEEAENILIKNCRFQDNHGPAISIVVYPLRKTATATIRIENCQSYRDRRGVEIAERVGSLNGSIDINQMKIEQSRYSAIRVHNYDSQSAPISLSAIQIIDPNTSNTSNDSDGSALSIVIDKKTIPIRIGSVKISKMELSESIPRAQKAFYVSDIRNDPALSPQKIYFTDPKSISWDKKRGAAIKITKGVNLVRIGKLIVQED
jgi:Right handed beta helix region